MRTAEDVTTLSWDDARELARESEVLLAAVPTYSGQGSAEHRDRNWQTRVTGTTAAYFDINAEVLAAGRAFSEREVAQRSRVAVLGDTVWQELADQAGDLFEMMTSYDQSIKKTDVAVNEIVRNMIVPMDDLEHILIRVMADRHVLRVRGDTAMSGVDEMRRWRSCKEVAVAP